LCNNINHVIYNCVTKHLIVLKNFKEIENIKSSQIVNIFNFHGMINNCLNNEDQKFKLFCIKPTQQI
jgi:hypothetical protein